MADVVPIRKFIEEYPTASNVNGLIDEIKRMQQENIELLLFKKKAEESTLTQDEVKRCKKKLEYDNEEAKTKLAEKNKELEKVKLLNAQLQVKRLKDFIILTFHFKPNNSNSLSEISAIFEEIQGSYESVTERKI